MPSEITRFQDRVTPVLSAAKDTIRFALRIAAKKILGRMVSFIPHVQRSIDQGLTVFGFHDVSNHPSLFAKRHGLVVSKETFERQIIWIKKNFEVVHPSIILEQAHLPKRAAVITFDDGFRGTFENGLPILARLGVPSIIFLNMQPILLKRPMLSAAACFLSETDSSFGSFCKKMFIAPPLHLSLSPGIWGKYIREFGDFNMSDAIEYQGEFANLDILRQWDGHPLVSYGNHLFEHWNAATLSLEELTEQYLNNEVALSNFISKINLFAFTNGLPVTCFTVRDIGLLKALGAGRVFSGIDGINQNKEEYLLGRIVLSDSDKTDSALWFRIGKDLFLRSCKAPRGH